MDALKRKFREGRHDEAIAECEALCRSDPGNREIKRLCAMMHALVHHYGRALELLRELRDADREDADLLFNIAMCESRLGDFTHAREHFELYTRKFPAHADGWVGLAQSCFELKMFADGIGAADRAISIDAASVPAWLARGNCQRASGRLDAALASYRKANQSGVNAECWLKIGQTLIDMHDVAQAIASLSRAVELAPGHAGVLIARGDALAKIGKLEEAVADFRTALKLQPEDADILKKTCLGLLTLRKSSQAIELCDATLKAHPGMPAVRIVREWVLNQLVPSWHVPMMNESERNQAYHDALALAITPDTVVFEIGTGSGLLAMMAARLGAKEVFTCEAVDLIADTARKIVGRNGYQDRITVIGKHSNAVRLQSDLPAQADILVHEIFSSDLLGEHLLASLEDAKQRLLKAGGKVLPSAGSIMIALVGGDELGRHLFVDESFGFDLRDFNAVTGRRGPLFRYDLETVLFSDAVEAFRFDFDNQMTFPAETRVINIESTASGSCHGVIQWIRIELGDGVHFENHPSLHRPTANWQTIVHRFEEPVRLEKGTRVTITAGHNQVHPWFEFTASAP